MSVVPKFETPYERRGVLEPGRPVLQTGVERHPIPGGGTRIVSISAGDEISLLDPQGLQKGELVFFTPDGKSDASMLGGSSVGKPIGTIDALTIDDLSAKKVLNALKVSGFDLASSDAISVFDEGSNAGALHTVHASADGLLVACAVGKPMLPEEQNAPTELVMYIRRANPEEARDVLVAPEPLADTLMDVTINPGNASAYEVKAGQYIQILDVQGRECSDFQAFSARALDKGLERDIDPTTTRTLMGSLYPAPGIFSKYFSGISGTC